MDQIRPSSLVIIGGGLIVLIASFLDWIDTFNAYEATFFGLTGIFLLVMALACIAIALLTAFAPDVKLPASIAGLSMNQVIHAMGFAVLVLSFSLLFGDESAKIGTILALIGSIAIVGGTHLDQDAAG